KCRGRKRAAWGYSFMRAGKQYRMMREEWSKEDAEKALAAAQLGQTVPTVETNPLQCHAFSVGEMLDKYLAARKASPKNRSYQDDLERSRPLLAFFGATTPATDITRKRITEYRLQRGATTSRRGRLFSPLTINRECQVLRGAMRYAHDELEVLATVPTIKMANEKDYRRDRWLRAYEIPKLLAACAESRNSALLPLVTITLHTGLRLGEV